MTLAVALALALLLQEKSPGAQEEKFNVTAERLGELSKEVRPVLEKATGRTFKSFPTLRVSTAEEVADALAAELEPQLKMQVPDLGAERLREVSRQSARALSQIYLAKYQPAGGRVHVISENFARLSRQIRRPVLLTPEFLRLLVIHELVHALDEQEHRVFARVADLKSAEELNVWNALLEGHAQHVTRAVLVGEGKEKLFAEYEELLATDPPASSEGEKLLAQIMAQVMRYPYIEGRKFFDALAATGRKGYVEDVFAKPPSSPDVILHPERYYDPKAAPAARDLTPLLDELAKKRPGWLSRKQRVGELEIRTSFGDFVDKDVVDRALKRLVGGQTVVLGPEDGSKMMVCLVVRTESAAAASEMGDVFAKVSRAKEERMKEGAIRITKATRTPLKTSGGSKAELTRMTIRVGGQTVQASDAVAVSGEWVVELLHSNEEPTDEEITALINRVVEFLSAGK